MSIVDKLVAELSKLREFPDYEEEFFKESLAFRLRVSRLEPVKFPHIPNPDTLLNIDRQKKILFRNTERFVSGLPANDVLLWGSRGTGKSSLVKSTLGVFGGQGLRIIQLHKEDIPNLSHLYEALRGKRFKFILFFDDLSFDPSEEAFKLLKSILDGDVEERPDNVLVYATSNRRHIMPDRETEEKFPDESLQERVSLVERFGIRLGFFPFSKEEYLKVVKSLLGDEFNEDVEEEALRWATERGSFSGRVALQFYKDFSNAKR